MIHISAAGRQNALSTDTSFNSETTAREYGVLQTQYIGAFGVMPALLPGSGFNYGVPYNVAQAMAERVIHEKRGRFDSLSPDLRRAKIQKQVDELKHEAIKVGLSVSIHALFVLIVGLILTICMFLRHDA